MEKLVKLLNEYVGQDSYWIDEYDNGAFITWGDGDQCFIDEHIISKKFGFIKWLVDNDKIDREKIDGLNLIPTLTYQNMIDDCDCGKSHWHPYTFAGYIDELLMLLAISDTPIEDLISYLK